MKKTKRILSIFLSVVMLLSFSVSVFASDSIVDQNDAKKAEIMSKLAKVGEKHGGKVELLSDEDAEKAMLKFDSVEEFDQWLDNVSVKVETKMVETPITFSGTQSTESLTVEPYTADCTADNEIYLTDGLKPLLLIGTVRQRILVQMVYNYTAGKYVFGSTVNSQSAYIYGQYYAGWKYDVLLYEKGRLDNARTLYGKTYGKCTLTVSIQGIGAGYTWDENLYNTWYYLDYQQ